MKFNYLTIIDFISFLKLSIPEATNGGTNWFIAGSESTHRATAEVQKAVPGGVDVTLGRTPEESKITSNIGKTTIEKTIATRETIKLW